MMHVKHYTGPRDVLGVHDDVFDTQMTLSMLSNNISTCGNTTASPMYITCWLVTHPTDVLFTTKVLERVKTRLEAGVSNRRFIKMPKRAGQGHRPWGVTAAFVLHVPALRRACGLSEVIIVPTEHDDAFMMKVLNIVYKLIQENKYCTKRDIYYQNPELFGSQSIIDNVVDNVACMLNVPRWNLHILATCKGLVAGDLQFYDEQGRHVDCCRTKMGVQIPAHDKDMLCLHTDARLVLVVEKDATFQKLLTEDFCQQFGKVIIITGKGYPDVGTRLLLRKVWNKFRLPVFALVDGDPHGIEIMLVYKYGSKNQAFENQHLTVPGLKWLGILPSDIVKLSLPESALQNLSDGDLQKLTEILQRPYAIPHSSFAQQVEMMIQSGKKAELQCLDSLDSSYLTRVYLPRKIHGGDWI